MASAISSEAKVIDGGAFKSYQSFRERMTELEQILEARHALAIVEYINQILTIFHNKSWIRTQISRIERRKRRSSLGVSRRIR